jgi:serine/threonine-protein kinase
MQMLDGRIRQYNLIRPLGHGRHGQTWLAVDEAIQRTVVLKFLSPDIIAEDGFVSSFENLTERINQLMHRRLAAIYGLDTVDPEHPFIIREYIDGHSLPQYTGGQPMFYQQFLDLASQIAAGVHAAHECNIVLKNLTPNNILITLTGQVRLVDFCLDWSPNSHDPEAVLAAARYCSPEQLQGSPLTPGSDLFTLGALYYELLTGERAFPEPTLEDVKGRITSRGPDFETQPARRIPSDARLMIERLADPEIKERMSTLTLVASLEGMLSYHIQILNEEPTPPQTGSARKYLSLSLLAVLLVIFWLVITTTW